MLYRLRWYPSCLLGAPKECCHAHCIAHAGSISRATCARAGYGGVTCKSCIAGFYRLEEKCVACPSAAYMLIFVYASAIGGWCIALAVFKKYPSHVRSKTLPAAAHQFGVTATFAFHHVSVLNCFAALPYLCWLPLHRAWRVTLAAVAVSLLGFARHKGVNLSVLGIGVDFLQVWLSQTLGRH